MLYFQLFYRFLVISLFSVGGGYSAMPIIQSQIVDAAGWMTMDQFADLITLSEVTPGPIILNAATFTGEQVAGFPGALCATLGSITPAIILVSLIAYFFYKNNESAILKTIMSALHPAACALVFSAGITMLASAVFSQSSFTDMLKIPVDLWGIIMAVICFSLIRFAKKSPIFVILFAGCSGLLVYGIIPQIFLPVSH